jgi:hypothetical protein
MGTGPRDTRCWLPFPWTTIWAAGTNASRNWWYPNWPSTCKCLAFKNHNCPCHHTMFCERACSVVVGVPSSTPEVPGLIHSGSEFRLWLKKSPLLSTLQSTGLKDLPNTHMGLCGIQILWRAFSRLPCGLLCAQGHKSVALVPLTRVRGSVSDCVTLV